jgi:ArsR family transcriptional regulator
MPDNSSTIFDVISDPNRRAILQLMLDRLSAGEGSTSPSDVVEAVGVSRQTAQRHLGILAEAGVAVPHDEGATRGYSLDSEPLEQIAEWLTQFLALAGDSASESTTASETVFSAWSGADVGETIGRTLADRTHQARVVIEETAEKVVDRLPGPIAKRVRKGQADPS